MVIKKPNRCCGRRGECRNFFFFVITMLTALAFSTAGCADRSTVNKEDSTDNINVYFNNDRLADDPTDCSAVFPVKRTINASAKPEMTALQSLFKGPSPEEQAAGYHSFFSSATKDFLKRMWVRDGVAYVDLSDKRSILSGATASCGSAEFHSQIERTLFQFPSTTSVIYAIDGNSKVFYQWMNEPCDETNNDCTFPADHQGD